MAFWIVVASADHVGRGVEGGFMQVCHGKAKPLQRIKAGDKVAYYSSVKIFGEKQKCQSFTAIGEVRNDIVYPFDMGNGFVPYRRDVNWFSAKPVSIYPLLNLMTFSAGNKNWAYPMRFGLFEISGNDFQVIASAMSDSI
jgi:hypothetical protein